MCKIKNHFEGSLDHKDRKKQKPSNKNNSTNFTESNDHSSVESLFTVTQFVNRVEKPGQPIVSLNQSNQKDISRVSVKCLISIGSTFGLKITKCFDKSIYLFSDVSSVTTLIIKELLVDYAVKLCLLNYAVSYFTEHC